jgi:hypothetical protein
MSARERELTESKQRCLLATHSITAEEAMRTAISALLMCCAGSTSGRDATCAANHYYGAGANAELQPNRIRQSRRRY